MVCWLEGEVSVLPATPFSPYLLCTSPALPSSCLLPGTGSTCSVEMSLSPVGRAVYTATTSSSLGLIITTNPLI